MGGVPGGGDPWGDEMPETPVNVLIVDDSKTARLMLSRVLDERFGWRSPKRPTDARRSTIWPTGRSSS